MQILARFCPEQSTTLHSSIAPTAPTVTRKLGKGRRIEFMWTLSDPERAWLPDSLSLQMTKLRRLPSEAMTTATKLTFSSHAISPRISSSSRTGGLGSGWKVSHKDTTKQKCSIYERKQVDRCLRVLGMSLIASTANTDCLPEESAPETCN